MGMDVYGENPIIRGKEPTRPETKDRDSDEWAVYWEKQNTYQSENKGVYFRNNVWWWRPLWMYVCQACDDVLTEEDCTSGHHNDGHLITEAQCEVIARRLKLALDNGLVEEYKNSRETYLDSLEQVTCHCCEGTGEGAHYSEGEPTCHVCEGTGKKDSGEKSYPFSVENVEEFVGFVSESGGFRISQ